MNLLNYKQIPKSWKQKKLSEICEIIGGVSNPKEKNAFENGTIPFVKMKDLGSEHLTTNLINTSVKFNKKFVEDNKIKIIKKGAILIPRSGSVALNHRAILGEDACIVSHICALQINQPEIDPFFLYYVLTQIDMKKFSKKTTGLDMITFEDLRKIIIPIPPIKEQQKIVGILTNLDNAKQFRKESNGLREDFIKSIFMKMFGDPKKSGKWEKKSLNEFGQIVTGNTPPRKNKENYGDYIDWIKSDNLNTPETFVTKSRESLSKKGAKIGRIVPKNSILITCIAGSIRSIGNIAISDKEVAFNQQINAIVPNEKVDSWYLYHLIKNAQELIQNASTKSLKGIVSKSKFSSIQMPCPPISLQHEFANIAKNIEKMRTEQKQSSKHIDNLFSNMMQRAFKGELAC